MQLQDPTQSFLSNTAWKCSFRKAYFQEAKILQGAPKWVQDATCCLPPNFTWNLSHIIVLQFEWLVFLGVTRLPFAEMPIFFSQFRTSAVRNPCLVASPPPTWRSTNPGLVILKNDVQWRKIGYRCTYILCLIGLYTLIQGTLYTVDITYHTSRCLCVQAQFLYPCMYTCGRKMSSWKKHIIQVIHRPSIISCHRPSSSIFWCCPNWYRIYRYLLLIL